MDSRTVSNPPHRQQTLTETAASSYVGFSRVYLRLARQRGRGPAYIRIGRAIRYRISDLDKWLDGHRVDA